MNGDDSMEPSSRVRELLNVDGRADRLQGRVSAYELLLVAGHPLANVYRVEYEQMNSAIEAGHGAVERGDIVAESPDDVTNDIYMTEEQWDFVERETARLNLTLDEYMRTILTHVAAALPEPPEGWDGRAA